MSAGDTEFIKSIRIKNVRGISDLEINIALRKNRPNLLIAPNGSGKTSFAVAFESLQENRINLPDEEWHDNNFSNRPEIIIKMGDDTELRATDSSNSISKQMSVFVLRNKVKAKSHNIPIYGRAKATLSLEPIVLVNTIPAKCEVAHNDIFSSLLRRFGRSKNPYSIKEILCNYACLSSFPFDDANTVSKRMEKLLFGLEEIVQKSRGYDVVFSEIIEELESFTKSCVAFKRIKDYLSCYIKSNSSKINLYALQICYVYHRDKEAFRGYIKRFEYNIFRDKCKKFFSIFHSTWKEIRPKEKSNRLIVDFPPPNSISNGERDILFMFSRLMQFENSSCKENCILIIDELFDYLDDSNFVAAQYYITKYIAQAKKNGKNIYPIILSHLHPGFYRNYAFNKLNVVYFREYPNSRVVKLTSSLLKIRTKAPSDSENLFVSRYLFHYEPTLTEPIPQFQGVQKIQWNTVEGFHKYVMREFNKYLAETGEDYDPIMVTVALRRMIEKFCYDRLTDETKQAKFICTHKTAAKMDYAAEQGVQIPEVFYLLGIIYNEALHCDDKKLETFKHTLASRLFNKTIHMMIEYINKQCSK